MRNYNKLKEYSVFEINSILASLQENYDIVRLVDVEECSVMEVKDDGTIEFKQSCFNIWNRNNRCANCSSLRACMTHQHVDKIEHLQKNREKVHSIPIYLELNDGELEMCVIECVSLAGVESSDYEIEEPAEYINTHDVLTRLYTQEKLYREIRQKLKQDPEGDYLLIMVNIRNFQVINRLFGVEGGNHLLTGIADIFREECSKDEVYGRYHDDRFVLLIKKEKFHENLFLEHLQTVKELIDSPIYTIQPKLGIYEITNKNYPVSLMLEHAEVAVDSIRDVKDVLSAHYEPEMLQRKMKDQRIISDFEKALTGGEFHIFLQPQVRSDGEILGGEVLVRWLQVDGSMMLPGEFLNVLHRSELLSHLDVYVWDKAAKLLQKWRGTILNDLYVSINVDPSDFYYMDVPKVLMSLVRKYDIDPKKLHVEITETALVEDMDRQNKIVEKLQSEGFIVEIDDFGKGYSSLSLLKGINANVLKIDMGFIQDESNYERGQVILESIIKMAVNLNMGVITEGVETGEQVEKLVRLGCTHFQGFYFSRPIPVSDFETVFQELNS